MPGRRLPTGDKPRGRLDLGEQLAHTIDSRLMGLFGGKAADRLRRTSVLQQDDFDTADAETIDSGLHADRRGQTSDYRTIEVARLQLCQKIAADHRSKCSLAYQNICILNETLIKGGSRGVLR